MDALIVETIGHEKFWEDVENWIKLTKPIYLLIKFADDEVSKMSEFYEKMDMKLGELHGPLNYYSLPLV